MTLKVLRTAPAESDPVLIFVHGILSNADACWSYSEKVTWPGIVMDDSQFPACGIQTFTYRSAVAGTRLSITDAADTLWERMWTAQLLMPGKLMVFVCHSMGGIVVRKMLVKRQHELLDAGIGLVGLILVASPSMGSRWATWLLPLTGLMGHLQAIALSSREGNVWLHELRTEFRNLCDGGRLKIIGRELAEEQSLMLKWVPWLPPIVGKTEAATFFANPLVIPGTDHFTIAKPANADDLQHEALRNFALDLRARFSQGNAKLPAGITFAQAMHVTGKSLQLDVDLSGLTLGERDVTSAVDRQISGIGAEGLLKAVATAFPANAIRDFRVTIRGTTASLVFPAKVHP